MHALWRLIALAAVLVLPACSRPPATENGADTAETAAAAAATNDTEAPIPKLITENGRHALLVDGEPFLILGAQVNNSSNYPGILPQVWPAIEILDPNTVMVPSSPESAAVSAVGLSWAGASPRAGPAPADAEPPAPRHAAELAHVDRQVVAVGLLVAGQPGREGFGADDARGRVTALTPGGGVLCVLATLAGLLSGAAGGAAGRWRRGAPRVGAGARARAAGAGPGAPLPGVARGPRGGGHVGGGGGRCAVVVVVFAGAPRQHVIGAFRVGMPRGAQQLPHDLRIGLAVEAEPVDRAGHSHLADERPVNGPSASTVGPQQGSVDVEQHQFVHRPASAPSARRRRTSRRSATAAGPCSARPA